MGAGNSYCQAGNELYKRLCPSLIQISKIIGSYFFLFIRKIFQFTIQDMF